MKGLKSETHNEPAERMNKTKVMANMVHESGLE
jgi:hypothetical protein